MILYKKMPEYLKGEVKFPYVLYLPEGYDSQSDEKWPLVLFLHGYGELGTDGKRHMINGLPQMVAEGQQFPFIAAFPQEKPDSIWSANIESLNVFLDYLLDTLNIDEDRVILTGISMGGTGAWGWAISNPDRFAALVPVCGVGIYWATFKLQEMPIWIFHGDADDVVPPFESQNMFDSLQRNNAKEVRFTLYKGIGHDVWEKAYRYMPLYDWMLSKNRKQRPIDYSIIKEEK